MNQHAENSFSVMNTTGGAFSHNDFKVWNSSLVFSVVGVEEIGAMKDSSNGFADIIDVRIKPNTREFQSP